VGTEDSGVILIFRPFIINVISLSSIKFCLYIYGVFIYYGGIFEFIYLKMYHIFYVNCAYFYVFNFLTTLKYHFTKFLELKPKDEVTLLSTGVLIWLILECFKLQFFPFISMGTHF